MSTLVNDNKLIGTITLLKATGTKVTLSTDNKYVAKDIELTVNASTASPLFSGGTVSGSGAIESSTSCSYSSAQDNSGVSITVGGIAQRAAVNYQAVDGWVNKSQGAEAMAAGSSTSLTSQTYYINGVTLTPPTSGTRTFVVGLPNNVSLTFNVSSTGDVVIT